MSLEQHPQLNSSVGCRQARKNFMEVVKIKQDLLNFRWTRLHSNIYSGVILFNVVQIRRLVKRKWRPIVWSQGPEKWSIREDGRTNFSDSPFLDSSLRLTIDIVWQTVYLLTKSQRWHRTQMTRNLEDGSVARGLSVKLWKFYVQIGILGSLSAMSKAHNSCDKYGVMKS